jgi:hypothetical protein
MNAATPEAIKLMARPVDVASSSPHGRPVTATFVTSPQASCQLRVTYDDDDQDQLRLPVAVADDNGVVSWTWTPERSDREVVAIARVACSGGERGESRIVIR